MNEIKHKYDCWFLPNGYLAITLGSTVHWNCSEEHLKSRWDAMAKIEHEVVHYRQIQKAGMFKFYTRYMWDYVKGLLKYRSHQAAYMNIGYEVEAYRIEREVRAVIRENFYAN
jgi:hypothetical protein